LSSSWIFSDTTRIPDDLDDWVAKEGHGRKVKDQSIKRDYHYFDSKIKKKYKKYEKKKR